MYFELDCSLLEIKKNERKFMKRNSLMFVENLILLKYHFK